ncbi:MAG: nascent polypeptide-associated complex protein [Candidatus Anstonellaceae archaeon]
MFGPNLDSKQLSKMLKQFGVESSEIEAIEVVIKTPNYNIVIQQPQVIEIKVREEVSYQISGKIKKEQNISTEEIKLIMSKTSCSEQEAIEALKAANYDIAKAIIDIEEKKKTNSF